MSRQYFKQIVASGDYVFLNANAKNYYDELVTANGGDIDADGIYSISLNALKDGIDVFFIALVDAAIYSKMIQVVPYIGATAVTHAINAVNPGTFDLTFGNSPTQNALGTVLNGTTQFINSNVSPSGDLTANDWTIATYTQDQLTGGTTALWGSDPVGANNSLYALPYNVGALIQFAGLVIATVMDNASRNDSLVAISRRSNTNFESYRNGVSTGTDGDTDNGAMPAITIYYGARNKTSGEDFYSNNTFSMGIQTDEGLTTAEHVALNTAVQALQTTLGRNV